MSDNKVITLAESQVDSYLAFLKNEQNSISEKMNALKKQHEDNEKTISLLLKQDSPTNGHVHEEGTFIDIPSSINGKEGPASEFNLEYSTKGSWWNKIYFVLSRKGKAMPSNDIVTSLYELEPDLLTKGTDRQNSVNVYAVLTGKTKDGKLRRSKIRGKGYIYGFPEWFEGSKIMSKYAPQK